MPSMRSERHGGTAPERTEEFGARLPALRPARKNTIRGRGMHRSKFGVALAVIVLYAGSWLHAQGNSEAAHLGTLNNTLLRLYGQTVAADASQQASLHSQASQVIAERFAALQTLIAQDPAAALRLAFDQNLLAALGETFPESASLLESRDTWEGPVEYVIFDDPTMTKHRVDIKMSVAEDTYEVHFPEHEPGWLKCGDILNVAGVKSGTQVAAASGSVTGSVAGAGCSTTGTQNIAVILIQFPGTTLPTTPAMVHDIFFGTADKSVDGYWRQTSYNNASATGDVFGPYNLSQTYTCDQYSAMRSAAIAAADPDVYFPNYTRIMIVFPNPGSCGWAGLGMLGCSTMSSADGNFIASTSWLLATYMGSISYGVRLATHEGGHNLTLHHASSRAFTNATSGLPEPLGALGDYGTFSEYGSSSNTMGYWNFGQYDAPHKAMIGWLTGSDIQTVQSNSSFTVNPVENSTGLRALKVQRGTGNNAWLWLEYRHGSDPYDSTLPAGATDGALIHYEDSYTGTHTNLLDFTPGSSGGFSDPALLGSWSDPYTNLTLDVQSASSTAMGVTISYGATPCSPSNPTISISPSSQSGPAASDLIYDISVTNNDSSSCDAASFDLSAAAPTGWSAGFASPTLSVAPGQNGSTTLALMAPAGTEGSFGFDATAMRGSNSDTDSATANIVAAPSTVVSTDQTTYDPRSFVNITATVTSAGSPADGASVVFTLTKPDGSSATSSATTDSSGNATWTYHLGKKDPVGDYIVAAQATYFGMTDDGTASSLFTVASSGGGGGGKGGSGGGGGGKGGGKPTK